MELVLQPPVAVQSQVPETRLPLPVSAQLVAGLTKAAVEAQIVSDGVLPAVWSCLKEGKMFSKKEQRMESMKKELTINRLETDLYTVFRDEAQNPKDKLIFKTLDEERRTSSRSH